MSTLQPASQAEPLSTLQPGDEFEIVKVLECGRSLPQNRFSPGRRWRCLYKGAAVMLLVGRTRETISIPVKSAQCVEVQRISFQAPKATGHARPVGRPQSGAG